MPLCGLAYSQTIFTLNDTVFQEKQIHTGYQIMFEFDKYVLRPSSYPFLDSLAAFLLKNDSLVIEVRNHCDSRRPDFYSTRLTQRRAQAVAEYLIAKGIDSARLIAKGYEASMPLISDQEIAKMKSKDEQERSYQKNRRTEFVILSMDYVAPLKK